jgi:hypothetical protein
MSARISLHAQTESYRWAYRIRIRGTAYLWGSAGIEQDMTFPASLLLHVRNDLYGQPVTLSTQVADGTQTTIGTLQAGEIFSIPIQGISGIVGQSKQGSTVECWIGKS